MERNRRNFGATRKKQSLYLPQELLDLLEFESHRLDRTLSWLIQRCVRYGLRSIRALPTVREPDVEHVAEAAEAAPCP